MISKPSRWLPAMITVLILFLGGALVRLGIERRMVESRSEVTERSASAAHALQRKLGEISSLVDRLTDELTVNNGTDDFMVLAQQGGKQLRLGEALLFLPSDGGDLDRK